MKITLDMGRWPISEIIATRTALSTFHRNLTDESDYAVAMLREHESNRLGSKNFERMIAAVEDAMQRINQIYGQYEILIGDDSDFHERLKAQKNKTASLYLTKLTARVVDAVPTHLISNIVNQLNQAFTLDNHTFTVSIHPQEECILVQCHQTDRKHKDGKITFTVKRQQDEAYKPCEIAILFQQNEALIVFKSEYEKIRQEMNCQSPSQSIDDFYSSIISKMKGLDDYDRSSQIGPDGYPITDPTKNEGEDSSSQ